MGGTGTIVNAAPAFAGSPDETVNYTYSAWDNETAVTATAPVVTPELSPCEPMGIEWPYEGRATSVSPR